MKNIFAILLPILLFLPNIVSAQIVNPLNDDFSTLGDFLDAIIGVIITLSIPVIVVLVIYAGFLFVTAGGKPEQLTRAKKTLLWTLVGALIILGAFVISDLIQSTIVEVTG